MHGITSEVDYLANTGIDAIWICPIFKSPMTDFGYDISHYKMIDPKFGTIEDFNNLRKVTQEKERIVNRHESPGLARNCERIVGIVNRHESPGLARNCERMVGIVNRLGSQGIMNES
ncbi:hypothetical protein C0J52_17627 [Blattella germanica]|nr:hypothetical protein C0J52_17627 [Blattella germanica]